jgi:hypothetical protein
MERHTTHLSNQLSNILPRTKVSENLFSHQWALCRIIQVIKDLNYINNDFSFTQGQSL